jgi:hypothetical protein
LLLFICLALYWVKNYQLPWEGKSKSSEIASAIRDIQDVHMLPYADVFKNGRLIKAPTPVAFLIAQREDAVIPCSKALEELVSKQPNREATAQRRAFLEVLICVGTKRAWALVIALAREHRKGNLELVWGIVTDHRGHCLWDIDTDFLRVLSQPDQVQAEDIELVSSLIAIMTGARITDAVVVDRKDVSAFREALLYWRENTLPNLIWDPQQQKFVKLR